MRGLSRAERLNEMVRLYQQRAYSDIEMAERLGVARETVYRDRIALSAEYPIEKQPDGRYRIPLSKMLSHVKVNVYEALMLYLALRRTARQAAYANPHTAAALEKLAATLHQPMTQRLLRAAERLVQREPAANRLEVLHAVTQGWVAQGKVRITYLALEKQQPVHHVIHPYLIEPSVWSDSIYVVAHSETYRRLFTFRLDRIQRAFFTGERFDLPADFDEETLFRHAWGIWQREGEPQKVRLKFAPGPAARRVQESVWHPQETVTPTEDGGCIWEAPIAEPREMLPWVRGWGADVEVLAPEALRRALEEEVRRLGRVYGISTVPDETPRFYAHSRPDVPESEWQLLKDHLTATAQLAADLARPFGLEALAYTAGLLHDIGKYSAEFQARLRGAPRKVDHATAGAREVVKLAPNSQQRVLAELVSFCIAGHHTGLPDYGSMGDMEGEGTLLARREKKRLPDYSAYKTELDMTTLRWQIPTIKPAAFREKEGTSHPYQGFAFAFLTRMLFSALTDADWLETERYMEGAKPRGGHADIPALAAQFNAFLQRFENPQTELNRKRTEILHACRDKASLPPGFFTLTVPTGGGKTFSSMAFALNHAAKHGLRRVIYVIPFTSIIEQNAEKFREALGPLGAENVLEHHSNFDWERDKKEDDDAEATQIVQKLKLAAENWDIPIVVTTNVQFFESLFTNKKRRARKLHNIARSVIIFDEVQTLPKEYLKPSLLAVQELVNNYGCTAVFCTATQPALERFFPPEVQFTELAPEPEALYRFFRRVKIQNLGELPDEDLLERLNEHEQALCIVNTRRHAKGLYDGLKGEGKFHLSTLMCPAHRREVLAEIRQRLANGRPCRVVSTQVMEAGIDVDFPVGYRALAGLDSIVQAAGRVNREMKRSHGEVYVFTPKTAFIKRTPDFIAQTGAVARAILREHAQAPDALKAIADYYEMLYTLKSEDAFDAYRIVGYFERSRRRPDFAFKTAAEHFRFIRQNTVPVIIPYNAEAQGLIEQLADALYSKRILRKLQIYTVNIYEREFERLQSKGAIWTIDDHYHVLDEERMARFYSQETGLLLPEEGGGEAIFFDG